jgi:hypothetical protein
MPLYTKAHGLLGKLKQSLLPDETSYRKVLFGLCKGNYLPLNLNRDIRPFLGITEIELIHYVKAYVRPGFCCYDIGANLGYYAFSFARLAAPGLVYAFEADPELCVRLEQTLAINGGFNGRMRIVNSFLAGELDPQQNKTTLDHLVFTERLVPPDVIKMDIDGPEYEVLCGAPRLLRECRPRMIVEVHSPELEVNCKRLLEESGYEVQVVRNNPWVQECRPHAELNRWLAAEPR